MDPVNFYKCLSDDTRLRCLLLIALEKELCVCELTQALSQTQPKISRHLSILKSSELLVDRRQGQWVFYKINPSLPDWAKSVLDATNVSNQTFLKDNVERLEAMGERPERIKTCC